MRIILRLDRQPTKNPYGFAPQEYDLKKDSLRNLIALARKAKARAEESAHVLTCFTSISIYKTYGKKRVIYTFDIGEKVRIEKCAFWI